MVNVNESVFNKKFFIRILFIILFIIPFFFIAEFWDHFQFHLSGSIMDNIITQNWVVVIINIAIFLSFLIPLSFRRKIDWKEYGLVTAFFVSLFIEMYGIPLTIYFAANSFTNQKTDVPNIIYQFDFFGQNISLTTAMTYGTILMIIGSLLILIGWVTLYKKLKKDDTLVTTGIYSYSRHPQYLGFIIIIGGWLIGWPTLLTLIFAPILVVMYIRVCRLEEKELNKNNEYSNYKKKVPFLI
jgi:protein-S-isoprenylcysteine O-methyltransferase Ste14